MGYKVKHKVDTVELGGDFEGIKVKVRSGSMDSVIGLMSLSSGLDPKNLDPAVVDDLYNRFAELLTWWNLEDEDGKKIPTTRQALGNLDFEMSIAMVLAWMENVVGVPGPLGNASGGGTPSGALPLPMEPLSASPAS